VGSAVNRAARKLYRIKRANAEQETMLPLLYTDACVRQRRAVRAGYAQFRV
jgi:hypothetical protein